MLVVSSTSGAVDREWPLRWANRRRRWAAGVPWARCRHRGPRDGPAWGTHCRGTRVEKPQAQLPVAHNYDRKSLQRSASLSVSEPLWGCYRTLDIRSHRCLQSIIRVMLAWARDATDFRPDVAKRGRRCLREPAHGLRAWPRAIARRGRAFIAPQDFGPRGRCTQIGVGARHDRFSTIAKRERRCLREPAHGLRAWPRAMAQRGRLLPDLSISAHTPHYVPDACSHRMQLSSLHPDEAPGQTVWRT